jgi:hypothetical protein
MRYIYIVFLLSCLASTNYAQFCSGTTTLTDCTGTFDDGSGSSNYANNTDCDWLIQVPVDSTILLSFNSFETERCCDELRVYNGSSQNAPLIGEYRGNSNPGIIQSSTNELYLRFTTDGSATREGWSVSYACNIDSFVDLGYGDPGFSRLLVVNGSNLEYDFDLQNTGNQDAGAFQIAFYASEDEDIDVTDELMFTVNISQLEAMNVINVKGARDVRDSIPPGTYNYVGFIIDPQNEIDEITKGNNTYQEDFERLYIPYCNEMTTITACQGMIDDGSGLDDVVRETQCSWLLQSDNDQSLYLDFFETDLFSSATIRIYDGEDQNAPLIQEFIGNENFYPVVSSGSSIFFEFEVFSSGGDGWNAEYHCTDTSIANMILEDESNSNSSGSTIDFDLEIRNNGNVASPITYIYFYGSVDNDFDVNEDVLLDSLEVPAIPAYGQLDLNHLLESRGSLSPGGYWPIAVIDVFDQLVELNEEDNHKVFSDQFYIPYCADTTTILNDCGGFITDGSGNRNFTPESDCSWRITADSGQYVSLQLLSAGLGSSSNSIHFYDGENNLSPLMAVFNGSTDDEIPPSMTSTGENLYVEFKSMSSFVVGPGWEFQYDCTEDSLVNFDFVEDFRTVDIYGDEIRYNFGVRNFGNIISPATKIYFILSPDRFINNNEVVLDSITIPPIFPYQSYLVDHDIISDFQESLILGGRYYPGFIIDPLDEVAETHEADNNYVHDRQIVIPFCAMEPQLIDDCSGQLNDGSGFENYIENSDCAWLIEGPDGANIRLTFTEFDTESCCDYVRIYDGSSSNAPLLGTYSGSNLPPTLETNQEHAFIKFTTDGSSNRSGWELEYECLENFSNLQFKSGSAQFQVVDNSLNFAAIIENDGSMSTGEFQIGFILSEDQIPNLGDNVVASEMINSLEPGEEAEYELSLELDQLNVPAGEYYLIVRLDLSETIEENDEMDNDFISAFPIDILSNTKNRFSELGIQVFVLDQHVFIKNERQHHLGRLSLIKADGVVLLDRSIGNSNVEHSFEVLNLPTGIYFLRLELEDRVLVKKLFIP